MTKSNSSVFLNNHIVFKKCLEIVWHSIKKFDLQKYFIIQCKLILMIFSDHRTGVHFKIPEMADR